MLLCRRLIYLFSDRLDKLQCAREKLSVVQSVGNIIIVRVCVLAAVCRKLKPKRSSKIALKVEIVLYLCPRCLDYRLNTVGSKVAVGAVGAGNNTDLRLSQDDFILKREQLLIIRIIERGVHIWVFVSPRFLIRHTLLYQDVKARLAGICECLETDLTIFFELRRKFIVIQRKQAHNVRRLVLRGAAESFGYTLLYIRFIVICNGHADRLTVGGVCIVGIVGDRKITRPRRAAQCPVLDLDLIARVGNRLGDCKYGA